MTRRVLRPNAAGWLHSAPDCAGPANGRQSASTSCRSDRRRAGCCVNRGIRQRSLAVALAGFLCGFGTAVISGADQPLQLLFALWQMPSFTPRRLPCVHPTAHPTALHRYTRFDSTLQRRRLEQGRRRERNQPPVVVDNHQVDVQHFRNRHSASRLGLSTETHVFTGLLNEFVCNALRRFDAMSSIPNPAI